MLCFTFHYNAMIGKVKILILIFHYLHHILSSSLDRWLNPIPPLANTLYSTFRSFNNSTMSICGLRLVPVLLEHSAPCRFLAAWFRDGRMRVASTVSFSPRGHRRTSFTSPSIFRERMLGNTDLTRCSTLFLKTRSRQTRFSMNIPGWGSMEG